MSSIINLILLPDSFADPVEVVRVSGGGMVDHSDPRLAHMLRIRTGEDMTGDADVRRYEFGTQMGDHLSDLVNNRVVIRDASSTMADQLPNWARNVTALHPERRDIVKWIEAASKDPEAPWINHLPLVVRDAMRDEADATPATVVMPDRAYVSALAHEETGSLKAVWKAFAVPAFEIDQRGKRTDATLPGLSVPMCCGETKTGLITRAQAIIAHRLCHALGKPSTPTQKDITARWKAIVGDDHEDRLAPGNRNEFVAPLAILEDHGETATLTLATLLVTLAKGKADIGFRYHLSVQFDASRPFTYDLLTALAEAKEFEHEYDRFALTQVMQEDALPVLEIASPLFREPDSRALHHSIGCAQALFEDEEQTDIRDAAAAYLAMVGTEGEWIGTPTSRGGQTTDQGDKNTEEVAELPEPPEPTSMDDTSTEMVGKSDEMVPSDEDLSSPVADDDPEQSEMDDADGGDDADVQGDDQPGDGDDDDGVGDIDLDDDPLKDDPPTKVDDQTETSGSQDDKTGAGQLQLKPAPTNTEEDADTDIADTVRAAIAGESDEQGDSHSNMGDKIDEDAHQSDDGETEPTEDGAPEEADGELDGDCTLDELLGAVTDTDKAIISDVREKVRTKKRKGVTAVPPDEAFKNELRTRKQFYDKALAHIYRNHLKDGGEAIADLLLCVRSPKPWVRLLFLINLSKALAGQKDTMHSVTKARSKEAAAKVIKQTTEAGTPVPTIATAPQSQTMEGGLNG